MKGGDYKGDSYIGGSYQGGSCMAWVIWVMVVVVGEWKLQDEGYKRRKEKEWQGCLSLRGVEGGRFRGGGCKVGDFEGGTCIGRSCQGGSCMGSNCKRVSCQG